MTASNPQHCAIVLLRMMFVIKLSPVASIPACGRRLRPQQAPEVEAARTRGAGFAPGSPTRLNAGCGRITRRHGRPSFKGPEGVSQRTQKRRHGNRSSLLWGGWARPLLPFPTAVRGGSGFPSHPRGSWGRSEMQLGNAAAMSAVNAPERAGRRAAVRGGAPRRSGRPATGEGRDGQIPVTSGTRRKVSSFRCARVATSPRAPGLPPAPQPPKARAGAR